MSDISLREYFAKLDGLLHANAADEVIIHCRHILQYFPKNVEAYRLLGRALAGLNRWDEAGAAFSRVLSVIPDDVIAHVGLGEVYQQKRRPDDAIWHLERAFEEQPNNRDLIEVLRDLYRRHRGVENAKIRLTASAVARQFLANGSTDQAIATLRGAIERMSSRIDLRVLLARALWESGAALEAGETALEVLKTLPDCQEANAILTQLWLNEDRPSDAQRYLNRVEAVDPYLAMSLAQGVPADDNAYRLEELDYQRFAQSELATNRPDWLQDIGTDSFTAVDPSTSSAWESRMLAPTPAQPAAINDQLFEDWLAINPPEETALPATGDLPASGALTGDFDLELASRTDFEAAPRSTQPQEEMPDWLSIAAGVSDAEPPAQSAQSEEEDALAWLRDSGIEIVDAEPEFEDPFANEDYRVNEPDDNPLAWLSAYEDTIVTDAAPTEKKPETNDPLAWLEAAPDADGGSASDAEEAMDWLQDSLFAGEQQPSKRQTDEIGGGDDAQDEPLFTNGASSAQTQEVPGSETGSDELDWLTNLPQEQPTTVPGPKRGLTQMLNEANFDWMQSGSSDSGAPTGSGLTDWLASTDLGGSAPAAQTSSSTSEGGFDWMSSFDDDKNTQPNDSFSWGTDDDDPASTDTPDWLSELEPEGAAPAAQPSAASDDAFGWMNELEGDDEPASQPGQMPDWLTALEPEGADDEPLPAAQPSGYPVEPQGEFTWMNELEGDDAQPAVPAEMPDWMSELEPEPPAAAPTPASVEPTGGFDRMSELEDDDAQPAAVPADMPDWMSELEPEPPAAAPTPASVEPTSGFDWMNELEGDDAQPAAVPADMPDWLTALEPDEADDEPLPAAQPSGYPVEPQGEFTWMNELEGDDALPAAAPATASTEAADEFNWMTELEGDDAQPAAVPADMPDWMSELEPDEATAQPAMASTEAADEFNWMTELEGDDQPAAVPAEANDEFAWMTEAEAETFEAQPAASFDWQGDDDTTEVEGEAAAIAAWTNDAQEDDDLLAAVPAQNAPDWLNAMVPGLDINVEAGEELEEAAAPAASGSERDFGWLEQIVDEEVALAAAVATETPPTPHRAPRFAFTRPPVWLSRSSTSATADKPDGDFPDWPSDENNDLPEWLR